MIDRDVATIINEEMAKIDILKTIDEVIEKRVDEKLRDFHRQENKIIKRKFKMKEFKLIEHIKNNKGNYVGTLVAIPYLHGYSIGWSKFNYVLEPKIMSKDMKKKGLEIASGRAEKETPMYVYVGSDFDLPEPNFPSSINHNIAKFIRRSQLYFKTSSFPTNIEGERK